MKVKKALLGLLAAATVATAVGCAGNGGDPTTTPSTTTTTTPAPSTTTGTATEVKEVKVVFNGTDPFDATSKQEVTVKLDKKDADGKAYGVVTAPTLTNDYKNFVGWCTDEALQNVVAVSAVYDAATFYAKWESKYEAVTSGVGNNEGLTSWGALAASVGGANPISGSFVFTKDAVVGPLTFVTNNKARFELKNGTPVLNTQGTSVKVELDGEGTNNEIHGNGLFASSTATERIYLYSVAEDGTETEVSKTDEYSGSGTEIAFDWTGLTAGDYIVKCSASVQYYNLYTIQRKEKSPAIGIELESEAVADYLIGTQFDSAGLVVRKLYQNGSSEVIAKEDLTIDTTAVNFNQAGEYNVSYSIEGFDAVTQKVRVYAIDSLLVEDYVLDSSRKTLNLEKVFLKDSEFTHANLAVTAVGKVTVGTEEKTMQFALKAAQFTVGTVDMTTAGEKTVTLTAVADETKTATYKINVLESALVPSYDNIYVVVDPQADVAVNGFQATFKTINDALRFIKLSNLEKSVTKMLGIKPGSYKEKVEFDIYGLTVFNDSFIANNGITFDTEITDTNRVTIWYDALNGILDNNGVGHSTDGSASVSVRAAAKDFTAIGITFKNYYNTHDLYTQSKSITSNTQAVALLVEADSAMFYNCEMSSYHDTLYARDGRQLYYNCYIEGRTDYIFGDRDVTAYFKDCTIHTLGANQEKNGGYVACNKGSKVDLAYVFDNCTFEADEATEDGKGVAANTVSLGRTWDEKMRLVIMNSTISGAYALADFGSTTEGGKNTRYTEMNNGKSPAKANIYEYNNTGDGALTAEAAANYEHVTVLAEISEAVAKYVTNDYAKLFSSNGTKTYSDTFFNKLFVYPNGNQRLYEVMNLNLSLATINLNYNSLVTFGVVGGYVSQETIMEYFALNTEDREVLGCYSDSALSTKFDFSKPLTATTDIYLKVGKKARTIDLPAFNGEESSEQTTWTLTATAGSQKISPTIGGNKDSADAVDCPKFELNQGLKNAVAFADGANKIDLVMLSSSTGTGNAINVKVNLYAQDGTTLVKTYLWEGVTSGKVTTKAEVTINSDDVFYFVEVLYAGYGTNTDKNFGILSLTGKVYIPGEAEKAEVTAQAFTADQLETGDYTSNIKWGGADSYITIYATEAKKVTVDTSNKKYTDLQGATTNIVNRIKTFKTQTTDSNIVEIDLSAFSGQAKLQFWLVQGGADRTVYLKSSLNKDNDDTDKVYSFTPAPHASNVMTPFEVTVNCGSKYYLTSPVDNNYLFAIVVTPVSAQPAQQETAVFSWAAIDTAKLTENGKYYTDATLATEATTKRYDQSAITDAALQEAFGGATNVAVSKASGASCTYRDGVSDTSLYVSATKTANNPQCIEIKNSGIDITFEGEGSITVSFSSTSGSNKSRLALVDADGKVVAASSVAEGLTLIETGDEAGSYEITGTSALRLTFTIEKAGTYTLVSYSATTTRGARITAMEITY